MFAIDGCKLPSNSLKEWSDTHDELKKKKTKIDKAVHYILEKHRQADTQTRDDDLIARELKQKEKLDRASQKINQFLKTHEYRKGVSGNVVKSNITANDSAKMKTRRGAGYRKDGGTLEDFCEPAEYTESDADEMTVGGELNKLASNVGMGRSMGGVHWCSDNTRSLRLGEQVAIEILRKRTMEYAERPVSFTFRAFDRHMVHITQGQVQNI